MTNTNAWRWSKVWLVAVILLVASCVDHDIRSPDEAGLICGVEDPVEQLAWVKQVVAGLESGKSSNTYVYFYLTTGALNGQTVFVVENCCPFCNTVRIAYNCSGEEVETLHYSTVIKNQRILWKPDGFQCSP